MPNSTIFLVAPKSAAAIEVSRVQPFGSALPPSEGELAGSFFPWIDRYGQLKHRELPGKFHSDDELKRAVEREAADPPDALVRSRQPQNFSRGASSRMRGSYACVTFP